MMEVWLGGWGDGSQGLGDVAPPRCQASLRRAESSLRTPGVDRRFLAGAYGGTMKRVALVALVGIVGWAGMLSAEPVAIFNGKDLEGWKVPKENKWWTAKEGVLVGVNDEKKKGSILWTEKEYTDFVFEGEFRYEGKIDSGVFLRVEREQIQIGISGSLKVDMTCSPYIAGKGYPKKAEVADILKEGEWNKIRIAVKGGNYKVWLAGKEVMDYTSETAVEKGPIGLQVHPGKEMKLDFRAMTVEE
jgi:hypothetical protein